MRLIAKIQSDPCDWHLLGCQVLAGGDDYINTVGTFGVASVSYYWYVGVGCAGTTHTVSCWEQSAHLAHGRGRRLPSGIWWSGIQNSARCILRPVFNRRRAAVLGEDSGRGRCHIGFELLHQSRHLGVSQRRAEWFDWRWQSHGHER